MRDNFSSKIDDTLLCSKYIYLDWNIFKYMKEHRNEKEELDTQFKNLVFKLKKKYKFPFSYAHIKDRANHYSEEHSARVKEDIEFVEAVTDSICVGISEKETELILYRASMQKCFDDYISKEKDYRIDGLATLPNPLNIDMERLDKEHPMYDFFERNTRSVGC